MRIQSFPKLKLCVEISKIMVNKCFVTNSSTAQKRKFSINDFFSKCDQIRRKLQIWSHLLKKSCSVLPIIKLIKRKPRFISQKNSLQAANKIVDIDSISEQNSPENFTFQRLDNSVQLLNLKFD